MQQKQQEQVKEIQQQQQRLNQVNEEMQSTFKQAEQAVAGHNERMNNFEGLMQVAYRQIETLHMQMENEIQTKEIKKELLAETQQQMKLVEERIRDIVERKSADKAETAQQAGEGLAHIGS